MSETVTLEIHRDAPPEEGNGDVLAKHKGARIVGAWSRRTVHNSWKIFEWWSEMPAPVKPKRFVVDTDGHRAGRIGVRSIQNNRWVADSIPTREAAQRIADIYEETTP